MIDQAAGRLRIDPGPFTIRSLLAMDEAARSEWWDHTSHVLAMQANCHRGKNRRAFQPREFHPFQRRASRGIKVCKANMDIIASVITNHSSLQPPA